MTNRWLVPSIIGAAALIAAVAVLILRQDRSDSGPGTTVAAVSSRPVTVREGAIDLREGHPGTPANVATQKPGPPNPASERIAADAADKAADAAAALAASTPASTY